MRKPRIAILGATGVVGREITKITEELGIEFETIKFLSSARSAGTTVTFKGQEYTVEEAEIDGKKAKLTVSRYGGKIIRVIPNDEVSRNAGLSQEELFALIK